LLATWQPVAVTASDESSMRITARPTTSFMRLRNHGNWLTLPGEGPSRGRDRPYSGSSRCTLRH
jgi:hypothetical protein